MNTSRKNKLAIAVVAASALAVAGLGTAGIKDTRHNLGSTGSFNKSTQTGEICVFCHTPHGSASGASVPLWNRSLTSGANAYVTYDQLGTSSLDGAVVQVGSVSIACLSCHDGTQAMDVMINEPGSGLDSAYTAAGMSGDVVGTGTTGGARMDNGDFDVAYLGTDLKNDHPIGIQYAGGGLTQADSDGRYADNTQFGDPDFKRPVKDTVNGLPIWWVPTVTAAGGTAGDVDGGDVVLASGATRSQDGDYTVRNKTDMQLYSRARVSGATVNGGTNGAFTVGDATAGAAEPYVECASCHDPHSTNPTFLRVENVGSAVCLACHTK